MESTISAQIATNSTKGNEVEQILGLKFWFSTPNQASLNHWSIAILATLSTLILIVVLTIVAIKLLKKGLNPPQQKYLTKLALILASFGPIGWVFVLARMFGIVFFSARFWWLLWFVALALTLFWLVREYRKLPAKQIQYQTYQLKK